MEARDNRNPYHNYSDIEKTKKKIEETEEMWNNENYKLLSTDTPIFLPEYRKHHCIQAQKVKEASPNDINSKKEVERIDWIPFEYEVATEAYPHYEKAKLKKDGTPYIRKKGNPILVMKYDSNGAEAPFWQYERFRSIHETISNDIQLYFEILNEYRFVWNTFTNRKYDNRRYVIICDVDIPYDDYTEKELKDFCKNNCIPVFTYMEKHTNNCHYQLGWILKEPIYFNKNYYIDTPIIGDIPGEELYKILYKTIANVFNGDKAFRGLVIKNPNYKYYTETIWNNDYVSLYELAISLAPFYYKYNFDIDYHNIEKDELIDDISSNNLLSFSNHSDFFDRKEKKCNSRHLFLLDELRTSLFRYRKEKGEFLEFDKVIELAMSIEKKSLPIVNKRCTRPRQEIINDAISVNNWVMKNYIDSSNKEKREFALIVKEARCNINAIKIQSLHKNGYSYSQISKLLSLNRRYVIKLKKKEIDINTIKLLKEMVIANKGIDYSKKQKDYLIECENALSTYIRMQQE